MWKVLSVQQKIDVIKQALKADMTQKVAAEILGCTPDTIRRFCLYWNLPTFPMGGRLGNQNAFRDGDNKKAKSKAVRNIAASHGRNLFKCERCGFDSDEILPIHHKDRDKDNNVNENFEILCQSCHSSEHVPDRKRNDYGQFI